LFFAFFAVVIILSLGLMGHRYAPAGERQSVRPLAKSTKKANGRTPITEAECRKLFLQWVEDSGRTEIANAEDS
jgi:hypothetical protein